MSNLTSLFPGATASEVQAITQHESGVAGGRTEFAVDGDCAAEIAQLAIELVDGDAQDDAASLLEAFRVAYPERRSDLDELVRETPALAALLP